MNPFVVKHGFIKLFMSGVVMLCTSTASSQEFSAGINITDPNPNAVLHLVSPQSNQGFLLPELTREKRLRLGASLTTKDNGLLLYDNTDGLFYFWYEKTWVAIAVNQTLAQILSNGNDANGLTISNVSDPLSPQEVATKNYVDNQDSDNQRIDEFKLNGSVLSLSLLGDGEIPHALNLSTLNTDHQNLLDVLGRGNDAGGQVISNISAPINPQDAATKKYVDDQASDNQKIDEFQLLDGSILSLSLEADGETSKIVNLDALNTDHQNLTNVLDLGSDAGGHTISNMGAPSNPKDATTREYVDNKFVSGSTTFGINNGGFIVSTAQNVNVTSNSNMILIATSGMEFRSGGQLTLSGDNIDLSGPLTALNVEGLTSLDQTIINTTDGPFSIEGSGNVVVSAPVKVENEASFNQKVTFHNSFIGLTPIEITVGLGGATDAEIEPTGSHYAVSVLGPHETFNITLSTFDGNREPIADGTILYIYCKTGTLSINNVVEPLGVGFVQIGTGQIRQFIYLDDSWRQL